MTARDLTFWVILFFLLIVPGGIIGWIRGRVIARTIFAIHADLRQAGIELSPVQLKQLISGLNRNPRTVLSGESSPVAKGIKQPHVDALLARTKPLKRYFWIVLVVGGGTLLLLTELWPPPPPHRTAPSVTIPTHESH